jgi:predicted ribosome quality control (RQC) complex YloA/Tae2 family protein
MFDFFFKPYRQYQALKDFNWIEKTTKRKMSQPLEQLQQEHQQTAKAAKEAQAKGKLIGDMYHHLAEIEASENYANEQGINAYRKLNDSRRRLRSLKDKLIEASRG